MKIAFFNTKPYDQLYFEKANKTHDRELLYLQPRLDETTVVLAKGFDAVCFCQ